jgi:hypothetical protein
VDGVPGTGILLVKTWHGVVWFGAYVNRLLLLDSEVGAYLVHY